MHQPHKILLFLLLAGGILYPFLVYFGINHFPPGFFVIVGMLLLAMRVVHFRPLISRPLQITITALLILSVGSISALYTLNPFFAVKAYPILLSLMVAALFGFSLLFPPTLIERIARLREPELPPEAILYTRNITWAWTIFLLINAGISLATALYGTLAQWTLWNGGLSYLCMGLLFAIEWIIRKRVRP